MATNYPAGIDSLTNPGAGDALNSPSHAGQHANANDAIEAIETELGTTPSGSESTVAARLTAIESGARMGTGSIGATALAANAVDTAAIADSAVTPAKLATTGRFVFPTGAANGYGFASGAVHLSGTGAPEGAVTAAPGSTWLQVGDAVTVSGNLSWRKATGTGNTGWVAEGALADTGWRNVSAGVSNAAKFQTWDVVQIRRVGAQVSFRMRVTVGTGTATGTTPGFAIYTLPNGFLPNEFNVWGQVQVGFGNTAPALSNLHTVNGISALELGAVAANWNNNVNGSATWATTDAWPASLPGSAV